MSFRDVGADHRFGGTIMSARRFPCLAIKATDALHDKASWRGRISSIMARSLLQNQGETVRHRQVTTKKAGKRKRVSGPVTFQHTAIQRSLAAECSIEAGRIYTKRLRDAGDTHGVITMSVEKALRDADRSVQVELTRTAPRSQFLCSNNYKSP